MILHMFRLEIMIGKPGADLSRIFNAVSVLRTLFTRAKNFSLKCTNSFGQSKIYYRLNFSITLSLKFQTPHLTDTVRRHICCFFKTPKICQHIGGFVNICDAALYILVLEGQKGVNISGVVNIWGVNNV